MAQPLRILDVGTGSGCLLLTLLCELPQAPAASAPTSARRRSRWPATMPAASACEQRVAWLTADALESVAGPFHMLVANPPYVRTADIAQASSPRSAISIRSRRSTAAPTGSRFYRRLARRIGDVVAADGWVVLEVGHDQADAVVAHCWSRRDREWTLRRIRIHRDVAGKRRCVAARTRWLKHTPRKPLDFRGGRDSLGLSGIVHASGQRSFSKRMAGC